MSCDTALSKRHVYQVASPERVENGSNGPGGNRTRILGLQDRDSTFEPQARDQSTQQNMNCLQLNSNQSAS